MVSQAVLSLSESEYFIIESFNESFILLSKSFLNVVVIPTTINSSKRMTIRDDPNWKI